MFVLKKVNIIRALSGIAYLLIILLSIYFSKYSFAFVFYILSCIVLWEQQKLIRKKGVYNYFLLLILFIPVFYNIPSNLFIIVLILNLLLNMFLVFWIFSKTNKKIPDTIISSYLLFSFFSIINIGFIYNTYQYLPILILFFIITCFDTFSYIIGSLLGRTKLFLKLSPNKTLEGFIGGLFFTLIIVMILYYYIPNIYTKTYSISFILFLTASISITGLLGDLIQSKVKRMNKVKDSSNLIPGHGGFYDRMDSVIFSAPFFYLIIYIFTNYVS